MRRAILALAVAGATIGLTAAPAAADPARPTDYESVITAIDPHPAGLAVDIVGGDAFLDVRVVRGHELIVMAFSGEPFLRITSDGTVETNQQSPYTYSVQSRYGSRPPQGLHPERPPAWKRVASGGTYTWHDHRIHWMSPQRKPGIEAGDVVQEWEMPMTFDGTPVTVRGQLRLADPISPLPWFGVMVGVLALVVLAGRGTSVAVASLAITAAAAIATYVGAGEYGNVPAGAGANALQVALPAVALVLGLTAIVLRRHRLTVVAALAAVAAIGAWAIMRAAVLFKPVLPTGLPFAVDRAGTAMAAGAAVAAAILAVRSGALVPQFAALEDD